MRECMQCMNTAISSYTAQSLYSCGTARQGDSALGRAAGKPAQRRRVTARTRLAFVLSGETAPSGSTTTRRGRFAGGGLSYERALTGLVNRFRCKSTARIEVGGTADKADVDADRAA
jgi:hypothetical protein